MKILAFVLFAAPAAAQFPTYTFNGQSSFERLGFDAAFVGDVNADGYGDVAAGGYSGVVRVFSGFDGSQLLVLNGSSGHPIHELGDLDSDGHPEIGVGWINHGVLVFSGATGAQLFHLQDNIIGWDFGRVFDSVGDLDGDGTRDIAVGAPSGYEAVRLFSGRTGVLIGTIPYTLEGFGSAISRLGDVNQDGVDDFLIGAVDTDIYHLGRGHVYVYSGATRTILQDWTGPSTGYGYGDDIVVIGDLDADGFPDYAAHRWANNNSAAGSVWPALIDLRSGRSGALLRSLAGASPNFDWYRNPRAAGDQNGDAIPDLLLQNLNVGVEIRSGFDLSLIAPIYGPAPYSEFGSGLSAGDTDRDGRPEIIVGDYELSSTPQDGYVTVYEMTAPPPSAYCTAKVNSLGCTPTLTPQGSSTLSGPDDFVLDVAQVRSFKPGMLLYSLNPSAQPFAGGTLCIGLPRHVLAMQLSAGTIGPPDCSGTYSFAVTHALMQSNGFIPGMVVFLQVHMRDRGFSPPNGVSLTDGLRVTIAP